MTSQFIAILLQLEILTSLVQSYRTHINCIHLKYYGYEIPTYLVIWQVPDFGKVEKKLRNSIVSGVVTGAILTPRHLRKKAAATKRSSISAR